MMLLISREYPLAKNNIKSVVSIRCQHNITDIFQKYEIDITN